MKTIFLMLFLVIVLAGCGTQSYDAPFDTNNEVETNLTNLVWIPTNAPSGSRYTKCWVWFYTVNEDYNNAVAYSGTICE